MDGPRVKRRKFARGEDDYLPGNITKIELHNFMTFEHIESTPGPRLNLVIGPNGSGKSSIVCAIALVLGGEPQLLGRASSVGAYVKRGEDSGYIRISLRGDSKDDQITIMRKIDTRNKSEWLLKGKVVTKKDVIEIIQGFNIQVNNLTQFLPQDRVCEFAKLSPVQLLEETEKAVGDPLLPLQHRALIEKSSELKKIKTAVEQKGESLNQMKALNAELEKDVERVRQREEFLAKARSMKKKEPWLKYDIKKAEYLEAQEQRRDAKKKLDEAAKTLNNLKEPIDKQKLEKSALDAKCKKLSGVINDNAKKRMELLENENHLGVQVQGKHKEISDLRRQEESRQQKILKAKEDLVAAELELENLPPYEPPKDEISSLGTLILKLEASANEKKLQKSEKQKLVAQNGALKQRCLDRLKDMENRNNKLLEALRKSGAEKIFEAYRLVQEHRDDFNKEVYGPVLLEVNVSDQVHADYLEGHVPYYIWKSFITQDSHDRDLLVRNLKAFDVPILNYSGNADYHHKEPFQVSEEMRVRGICSRLDQVFDAPNAVKEVLISQFGLDRSYIGSKETDKKADEVSRLGILDFWTPDNHYRWCTSRYGGHVSASVQAVDHSRLISYSSDVGEVEKLKSHKMELEETISGLEDDIRLLQSELRQIEGEAAKLHKQREEIITVAQFEKRKRREMENRVDQRRKKLEAINKQDDVDTSMAKLIDQIAKLNRERFRCAMRIKKLLVDAVAHKRTFAEIQMASIEFDAKIREMEVDFKHHAKIAEDAALHFGNCEREEDKCRKQLASAKCDAESVAVLTPELKKAFIEMPQTLEELKAAIEDNVSQANSILLLNNNVLEEYEHRRRQIEEITDKLDADKKQLESYLAEIDALKEKWLPTLRNLVAQINNTFSHNFKEMAVAGEVLLDEHDMEFEQYGILIKVKFRQAGQLQVLSAHHQSGGERSVSTILYLVSLQDLTNCPFRVVDEINQGMDPINERKMFQQLVRAASQPNTPQCFLLTPKLLPDLEYSDACSILNIMNGPWIAQPSEVWKKGGRWGSIMGLLREHP